MENSRLTRSISLAISLAIIVIYFTPLNSLISVNFEDANRLLYPLKSANAIHSFLNAYCLLGLTFIYRMELCYLVPAYLIAVTAPDTLLENTVGFSGVIYAALGIYTLWANNKIRYISFILFTFAVFFLFGKAFNNLLHIYCFSVGFIVSILLYRNNERN